MSDALPTFGEVPLRAEAGETLEWLNRSDIEAVHVGLFDSSGTFRDKRMSASAAARAIEQGWSFIDAIQWWGPADDVWREGGSTHQPVMIDRASGRPFPFESDAALFVADFVGPLADLSPRHHLGRMVERACQAGLHAEMGWEFECIVLKGASGDSEGGDGLRPAMAANRCWSGLTMATDAASISGLVRVLGNGAVPLNHICAELGPGCLELATDRGPVLKAADDAALAKLFTKAYFAGRNETATFMAQLGEGYPGLGGHPSLSFHSTHDGSSALVDDDGGLSKVALSAIAGVVSLLPDLLVMAAPNPNSYRRFGPGNWAPSTATWGVGNYSCALRVVAEGPESTRLELRIPGADTSPHLCAAMFVGAALWGIEHGLEPPAPIVAPVDGRENDRSDPLPRDLVEAVGNFSASPVARALYGAAFVEHYSKARLVEDRACRRFVSTQERHRYLHHV
jgi:glutamine synthetase